MCGRYLFVTDQGIEIQEIVRGVERRYGEQAWCPGEIRPTAKAPVLVLEQGGVHAGLMYWGYQTPSSLIINARAESAAEKPLFRSSVRSGRCVIPSTGFYEWDRQKHKHLFTLPRETALYMAGLYSLRDGEPRYCILTTAANKSVREIHHRMPLVLRREQVRPWLENTEDAGTFLGMIPPELEQMSADAQTRLW